MEKVERLIALLEKSGLDRLEYSDSEISLTLEKGSGKNSLRHMEDSNDRSSGPDRNSDTLRTGDKDSRTSESAELPKEISADYFLNPLAGVFYSRPDPDAMPYIRKGDRVKKGQVLYIIETMKIMNEIRADRDFTVNDVLIEDGEIAEFEARVMEVEYGQGES